MLNSSITPNIKNRDEFLIFLKKLIEDFKYKKDWENNDLESFLTAMLSWVEDADGYYENINELEILANPSWRLFADILNASTMYE